MKFKLCLALLCFFFAMGGIPAHAQIIGTNLINESDIQFKLEPEFPAPHEPFIVTIQSYVINLDKASIAWTIDGKDITQGYGVKAMQLTAKDIGQQTAIKVIVEGPERPLEKTFVFQPSTLDLMWESVNSYAPPFYKGKKLPVYESIVKVAAIPDVRTADGREPKDSDVVYTWRHERKVVQDQSGYGKSGLLIKKNRLQSDETIDVTIGTRDSAVNMEKRIHIPTFFPQLVITPVPFSAIATSKNVFETKLPEIGIVATPYNFTVTKRTDTPYRWTVGDQVVTSETGSAVRIKEREDVSSAAISVQSQSPANFIESAIGSITINFK